MSEGYYDTNPPLSILVQIPPALLVQFFGIPLYHAVLAYGLAAVALSAWAVHLILKTTRWLDAAQRRTILMGYILLNTVGAGLYLGEKDQLLGLALFPFVLVQAAMTYNISLDKRLQWSVIGTTALLILLKPHYGIVPAVMFAHRAFVQRQLRFFKDPDFIGLCCGVVFYLVIMGLFFQDFVAVILPDILTLYVSKTELWAVKIAVVFGFTAFSFAAIAWLLFEKPQKFIARVFGLSVLCIIPYAMQGKGFYYHSLPAVMCAVSAFSLLAHQLFYEGALKTKFKGYAPQLGHLSAVMIIIALLYTILPPNRAYPTHDDYRGAPLAHVINDCDQDNCTFFLFNDMIEMTYQLSVYTGQQQASRFPSLWFLPGLVKADAAHKHWRESPLSREEINRLTGKYTQMIVEDFQKYAPDTLIIGHFYITLENPNPFDFVAFFSEQSIAFQEVMRSYRLVETHLIDRKAYFGGTLFVPDSIRYDVYKKQDIGDKKR
jgi:hypothetical protein